jgi:hypothetical protein
MTETARLEFIHACSASRPGAPTLCGESRRTERSDGTRAPARCVQCSGCRRPTRHGPMHRGARTAPGRISSRAQTEAGHVAMAAASITFSNRRDVEAFWRRSQREFLPGWRIPVEGCEGPTQRDLVSPCTGSWPLSRHDGRCACDGSLDQLGNMLLVLALSSSTANPRHDCP